MTQLLRRMKNLLEVQIGETWVEGEISNMRKQASGHWYFSLKDEGAQISCAMFNAKRREGAEALVDGAKVRVFAEASVYEARGQLQIIVQKAERAGAGDLQARFEALKRKLHAEGLFDADRKKPVPPFPKTIGLVTSGSGAALQDILNVLARRAPWVQPVLFPVRVQGRGAELEIAQAIEKMGRPEAFGYPRCDVLIVGRGGGSIEDLWNFNEEVVARAIAACPIPVISAVGHEIDFTIADFVADLRAPTPSAAAELAVADGAELSARLAQIRRRMTRTARERLAGAQLAVEALKRGALQRDGEKLLRESVMRVDSARGQLSHGTKLSLERLAVRLGELRARHKACHPARILERRMDAVAGLRRRLERTGRDIPVQRAERLDRLRGLLRALGPESAFQRGFSITLAADGKIVTSAAALKPGEMMRTKFADGETTSIVTPR
ncbi:exodeoxyribonuclease VII large subunit [Luteolibacter yonseiensis]|uniref:Exodeoxyribonuclease 7 large subunit n=1 Tax=Luteolibacter yonseiensis TaxID=1144680 RepID=A0A934V841_9BACT|nr:exodeoxyribonuclease VII large subunit [Luteolibacter yonseiensis]